jgi:protein O-mannosyl-transferase
MSSVEPRPDSASGSVEPTAASASGSVEPMPAVPMKPPPWRRALAAWKRLERWLVRWFDGREPTLRNALVPMLIASAAIFMRRPDTNYIFDEQEALLANPYVNAADNLAFGDVIYRDFWGLPPNASIGSYRPLPNVLWRALWTIAEHPFFHHLYNLIFHALAAAVLASFAYAVTRRRLYGWLAGAVFVSSAILTEAVSGIVGLADVLSGLAAVVALSALRLPCTLMGLGVFAAVTLGLFSKESALVCVPLIPAAALLTAPALHPERPARFARALVALLAAAGAFVLYVELRKVWFPSPLPADLQVPLPADASWLEARLRDFLVWFHQAPLPHDPRNNPLAGADRAYRIAGAFRVYFRGLGQVAFPLRLSGDYSYPQEPVPDSLRDPETIAGGVMMVGPLLAAAGLLVVAWLRELGDKRRLLAAGALTRAIAALHARGLAAPLVALERRPFRAHRLSAGILVTVPAAAVLAFEVHLIRSGTAGSVRFWPYALGLFTVGLGLLVDGWRGQRRPMAAAGPWPWRHAAPVMIALGLVWLVVSYFPLSNIPVVLPTVRAERFWYLPVVGTSLVIAVILTASAECLRGRRLGRLDLGAFVVVAFLTVQVQQAYRHAMDYRSDLDFWRATKDAVPRSAKAHLNYSVMVGARGDLETRLRETLIAIELSKEKMVLKSRRSSESREESLDWAMAHVYAGDTLCRMKRPHDAMPHYLRGFELGPNEKSLISLALQCLYSEGALFAHEGELRAVAGRHEGSWLAHLVRDTLDNHEKHKGVDPQHRPRGYNQGPKE